MRHYFFLTLIFSLHSFGQINFTKDTYYVNDQVIVTETNFVTAVENGIEAKTQKIELGNHQINLGIAKKSGIYPVTLFTIDGSQKTFLIFINSYDKEIEKSVLEVGSTKTEENEEKKNIFKQLFIFFQQRKTSEEQLKPFLIGIEKYCSEKKIDVVKNITFCLGAISAEGTVPFLNVICTKSLEETGKGIAIKILDEIFLEMYKEKYITKEQFEVFEKLDEYENLSKLLDEDCSAFFDLTANQVDQTDLISNKNQKEMIKAVLNYQGQLCSSTILILKKYKKYRLP